MFCESWEPMCVPSQLSDRYGRTRILGCAVVGVLIMDLCFLSTFSFYEYIPGGYWFLLIGPIFEGFLGGT